MWNPFKKDDDTDEGASDGPKMNMMQRLAMKKMEKMSPEEREKLMKKVMTPENIHKHKDDILKQMEEMKKSGQMNEHQINEAKRRLGIF